MITHLQFHFLQSLFRQTLQPFDSAAIVNSSGEVLGMKYESLADIGTLGAAAQVVVQYFSPKANDLILLNDPYSGGTTLSSLTLVTRVWDDNSSPLYLCVRTSLRPQFKISEKIEEEGLRIPPTPIAQNREINQALLAAMTGHPQAPADLAHRLTNLVGKIWTSVDYFQAAGHLNESCLQSSFIQNYFKACRSHIHSLLQDKPRGEIQTEETLPWGETLRVKLTLTSDQIKLDFSGTSPSKKICLTDAATLGACAGALMTYLNPSLPLNSSLISFLELSTPLGSFLNAKYPSPTFRGMGEGCILIASTVLSLLQRLNTRDKEWVVSPLTLSTVRFQFDNKSHFFESLPSGSHASPQVDGLSGAPFWVRNQLKNSVQEIESVHPLRIHQISTRKNSGGPGTYKGGDGVVKEYEVLAPAHFAWSLGAYHAKLKKEMARPGSTAEIRILRKEGSELHITDSEGEVSLNPGDRVTVLTAGGHGYGKGS